MFAMGPTLLVQGGGPLVLSGAFAPAAVGAPYSSSLAITGGTAPYSLTGGTGVASGSLPAGLSLSIAGSNLILSGTPTTAGTSSFTVSVTSADAQVATSAQSVTAAARWYDTLFAAGGVGMVFDFTRLDSMYQDTAGTVPVTAAGDPIGAVRCQATGSLASKTAGSATLAYDSSRSKFYANFDASCNFAAIGTVPSAVGGNSLATLITACGFVSTANACPVYVGPSYPSAAGTGGAIALTQELDPTRLLDFWQGGANRGRQADAAGAVGVYIGRKGGWTGATNDLQIFVNGVRSDRYSNPTANPVGAITAMNYNIGRAYGAMPIYVSMIINRRITDAEVATVSAQAL